MFSLQGRGYNFPLLFAKRKAIRCRNEFPDERWICGRFRDLFFPLVTRPQFLDPRLVEFLDVDRLSGSEQSCRRVPRRKTADLYFFVRRAAGLPARGPRVVCVPYTGCPFYSLYSIAHQCLISKSCKNVAKKLQKKLHKRKIVSKAKPNTRRNQYN